MADDSSRRSCNVCSFDPFWDVDDTFNEMIAPNLTKLRNHIRQELQESQRQFLAEVDRKLEAAFNADADLAVGSQTKPKPQAKLRTPRSLQEGTGDSVAWWSSQSSNRRQSGSYQYLGMTEITKQPSMRQLAWQEDWLKEVSEGELDVYTCLGLSNCFSWTADKRRIVTKAIAVAALQLVVPMCLLWYEVQKGLLWGPAEGSLGFRLVGVSLYGYAIYNMYNGVDGHCRTSLLNMMFQYEDVSIGHWLPLVIGEISNIFTANVMAFALYSIFKTVTEPIDLILNAIAVNFLCDCDGSFVDPAMREEAIETFKTFSSTLFRSPKSVDDPSVQTGTAKLVHLALFILALVGLIGCTGFMFMPPHEIPSEADPSIAHVANVVVGLNNTLSAFDDTP